MYSSSGEQVWAARYERSFGIALAPDHDGNVIVTGGFGVSAGAATIKYSTNGTLLWTNHFAGNLEAQAIALDEHGDAFVAVRTFSGTIITIKYSSAGIPLWTNFCPSPVGGGAANAIAVDTNGNVIVTGYRQSGFDSTREDYITLKYTGTGIPLWTNLYSSPTNEQAVALAVDASGAVFVTGTSGLGIAGLVPEATTIAYSSEGLAIWTNRLAGSAVAMSMDPSGNTYVVGTQFTVGTSKTEIFTVKYASLIPSPVPLRSERSGDSLVLSWADARFHLQSSPSVNSTFTNIQGVISPVTITNQGAQQFFRLATE